MNLLTNKDLKRRIIEISYKKRLSHLGSCLTAVDIIEEIFNTKKPDEKFVLSSGHAGLALYVVLEKYWGNYYKGQTPVGEKLFNNAEEIFDHHGVHPDRCEECHIDCSAGSLGNGLCIATGMALADRSKNVYCLISDGECSEGSIFEAFIIMGENHLKNLKIYLNWNGWGAYKEIIANPLPEDFDYLYEEVITTSDDFPFLIGQKGHYAIMTEEEYNQAMEILR